MTGKELSDEIVYTGQERDARKLLLESGLAKAEEAALMADSDVYNKLAKEYELVKKNPEEILLIKKEDLPKLQAMVKVLKR